MAFYDRDQGVKRMCETKRCKWVNLNDPHKQNSHDYAKNKEKQTRLTTVLTFAQKPGYPPHPLFHSDRGFQLQDSAI